MTEKNIKGKLIAEMLELHPRSPLNAIENANFKQTDSLIIKVHFITCAYSFSVFAIAK